MSTPAVSLLELAAIDEASDGPEAHYLAAMLALSAWNVASVDARAAALTVLREAPPETRLAAELALAKLWTAALYKCDPDEDTGAWLAGIYANAAWELHKRQAG